jgi:hypothetical protein
MNVRLHIDRLVLEGIAVPHADRRRLQATIERELQRLIGESGVSGGLSGGMAVPSIRGEDMRVGDKAGPAELGQRIAGALYGGLRR